MSDTSSFYSTSSKPQIEEAPALADVEKAFDNAARRETPWATPRTHPRTCAQSDDAHSDTISFISVCFSPPERYLAQQRSDESFREKRKRLSAIVEAHEQRHPGKAGVKLSRFSRPFDPDLDTKEENEYLEQIRAAQGETWGWPLFFLLTGICLAMFLISLDRTIITTAIPYMTSEFSSTRDIGWYGSSYLLTACAFQPVFGRVFLLFSANWSYLLAIFVLEIGSLICGVASDSVTLIIGRAIAGFGSAGILTGSFVLMAQAIPLKMRPVYTAFIGMMFGIGATCGPLFGGIFTDLATWRWCFYINLPVGAVTIIAFLLFFKPKPMKHHGRPFWDKFLELDIVGNIILIGAAIMLFLALEFNLQGYPWSSASIIGLLCGFGVMVILFWAWQWWKQDGALLPPAIVSQRSVAASCVMAFMIYGALLMMTFFLPLWLQGVLGDSALKSGVNMIPYFLVNAVASLSAGVFVSIVGYYVPPCIVGNSIAVVGCGMLTTLSVNTTTAQWVGYQILVATGIGFSIQQGFMAVQTVLPADEIAIGTAAVVACQSFGGAVFISVGNNIFQNHIIQQADGIDLSGVDIRMLVESGATAFRNVVSPEDLPGMIRLYNDSLRQVFIATIPLTGLALVACLFMEWRNVRTKN
ncbi:hypothetical protein S40285_07940 [Stachybotrys chlorohalonatus IBT 40285]|uniref:Major facilitator superfamily (MFS) profile domain-containing protein n=1 Tax=Stachybotrys chlorohalonatus (strain IBT 40285) TaxID=1283841 RepID=A0A084Q9I6_STAC4|nr:hypothetical protein S40285_07940 [Stachybotrys chlorohalonata IBT 40285]